VPLSAERRSLSRHAAALARAAGPDPSKLRGKTFVFSNWPLYIDVKGHRHPSLDQFSKKYGVKVRYIEDINDNASFFGKIQAQLRRGQSIGRDLIVMTDNSPYPALLVKNKWVEKLDKSVFPTSRTSCPASASLRGIRTATTACRGCRAWTGSATTRS
jgi:spermidine/putrescine-binding protein